MTQTGSLYRKYVVYFVGLVCGTLAASSMVSLYFTYQESQAALLALQREKALAAATRIETFVQEIEHQLGWMRLPQIGAASLEQRRIEYLTLLRQVPAITEVSMLDPGGREQLRVSRLGMDVVASSADLSSDPRFTVPRSGKTYLSPVYFRKETEPYMTIAVPGMSEDIGITVAEVNLKFIWDVISRINVGDKGFAYVVDSRGQLIAHPDISMVLQKSDLSTLAQVKAAREGEKDAGRVAIATDSAGREVLTAYSSIPALGWHVFVERPLGEAFAPLYALLLRTGLLLFAGLSLAVFASLYFARRMVMPIRALQAGASEIGRGRLDQRIEVRTGDELEGLAEQFNSMAQRLKESYSGLERKVEERTEELEIANRHKSEFLANMSHELRTPLNAIIGFSEVLQQRMFGEMNEKQIEYIDDIYESGKHLLSLINDILDLSKVEAGRMELDLAEFDVAGAIANALTLVKERAHRHGIALGSCLEPSLGTITGDERKFKQVMVNLLSNAVKFTAQGGQVSVEGRRLEGGVEISVTDTGVGIAPEDQDKVFEEFRQVGSDITRKSEGTGLGLALARSFVELHGGTIRVESEPGKGSVFSFILPLAPHGSKHIAAA